MRDSMDHSTILLVGAAIVVLYFWSTIKILKKYERGVAFRPQLDRSSDCDGDSTSILVVQDNAEQAAMNG